MNSIFSFVTSKSLCQVYDGDFLPEYPYTDFLALEPSPQEPEALSTDQMTSTELAEASQVVLPRSRTPIIDAFVYCALKNIGISLRYNGPNKIKFYVYDCQKCFDSTYAICNKLSPTTKPEARLKALRRWFGELPNTITSPDMQREFIITVKRNEQNQKFQKIRRIIDNIKSFLFETH